MSRRTKIQQIVQKREPLVSKIKQVNNNLTTLKGNIDTLESLRVRLMGESKEAAVIDFLRTVNLADISVNISHQINRLTDLMNRYQRGTINIGVVGLMGQGKSTFLQRISGLGDDVIPAKEGAACTACKSKIEYKEGETEGEVTFHTQESFLTTVITPYYEALKLTPPQTIEDFEKPLPVLDFSNEPGDAPLKSIYGHLKDDYHDHLQQYKHHLQIGSPKILSSVPKSEIYKYVSQPRDEEENLICFDHCAVNSVKISCPFPNQDVQQIALVDVPGLGDTRLGDEQLMRETLGQEVDLVLFIRRPDPVRQQWDDRDTKLYRTAYKALDSLNKRSFMVLNNLRGTNLKACQVHKNTIQSKHIDVVRCEIANCNDSSEANHVLDLVLDYMIDNITSLDEKYVRTYQEELNKLQQRVTQELAKARQDWTTGLSKSYVNEQHKFLKLFSNSFRTLKRNLYQLEINLKRERQLSEEDENNFRQEVISVIENCKNDTGIPDIEQIIDWRIEVEDDWLSTYARYLHDVRTHLTRNFTSMENGMSRKVEEAKEKVNQSLRDALNLGNIPQLVDLQGSEFLKKLLEFIPDQLIPLKRPIETLANFEMSYRNHIRYLVRPYLDALDPNTNKMGLTRIELTRIGGETPEITQGIAEEIKENLETLRGEVIHNCEVHLPSIYSKPGEEIFMEIEEFVDQILRSEGVKDQWRIFLSEQKFYIWPEEFGGDTEQNHRQQWLNAVEQVAQVNQLQALQFVN